MIDFFGGSNMTKVRYSFGGGAAVRQPCAGCTGAAYERSTEPAKQLPILGWRHTHNDERDCTGTALAGDDMGADYRLYAESSGQHAPGGEYRRRVGSCADCGSDAKSRTQCWRGIGRCARRCMVYRMAGRKRSRQRGQRWAILSDFDNEYWRRQTHAHREQVHGLLYVPAHRLTPKGVAV